MTTWFVDSNAAGTADGLSWTNAKTTLSAALTGGATGDRYNLGDDSSESNGASITLACGGTVLSPSVIYCCDHTQAAPGSGDLKTTGVVATTGAFNITVTGLGYFYGVTLSSGSTGAILLGGTAANQWARFENSQLNSITMKVGTVSSAGLNYKVELANTSIAGAAGTGATAIAVLAGEFTWRGGALQGTAPANLFIPSTGCFAATVIVEGVDLSLMGSGKNLVGAIVANQKYYFVRCKINAAVTVAAAQTQLGSAEIYLIDCDSGGTNYRNEKYQPAIGQQTMEATFVRTGGANNGTLGYSWKLVTAANAKWITPFRSLPIAPWNDTLSTNRVATVEGMWNAAALPNNDDIWLEVDYLGAAGSPLGSIISGTKANNLATGSALTASTQAWDGLASARANLQAYALGAVVKVASNPGRLFFCTTSGTTAVAEPGGFASAVDGGSVTDGTAVFRAAVRFTVSVTMSAPQPAQKGPIYGTVKAATVSTTFYIDPKMTLS